MIEIRLHETHHELDHIFILESRQTFRGKPKPLAYPHAIHRLRGDIINKVHYAVVDNLVGNSSWNKEEYQRTQLFDTALRASGLEPEPHDILMVSDLDEIPQPQFLRAMKRCTGLQYPAALLGDNHYYSYNYVNGQQWGLGPLAIKAEQRKYWTSQTLRSSTQWRYNINVTQYRQASWHCSYCFSHATAFQKKLASFSHKEFDTPYYHDVTRLVGCLKEGWGLFQQNIGAPGVQPEYMRVPTDKVDAPQYVLKHPKRFAYLISRDGDSGGLVDVQMRAGKAQLKQHRQRKGPEHRRRVRG